MRRIFVFCVLVLALASCAPALAPRGVENDTPSIQPDAFLTRDGLRLPLRHWDADRAKVILVALHGMSDYSNAFAMPAAYWATQGISTYAYDQRGFGRAPNAGLWPGSEALRNDLDDFVDSARAMFPGTPVLVLGESMGGAVVLSALASAHPPATDGVILVAPAVWSRSDMPASYRIALWVGAHALPSMTVSGNGLKIWPSDNIEMLKKLARDPLFQHTTRADAVYGLVNLMDEARRAPAHLVAPPPVLFLYGENDQVIPAEPTDATIGSLGPRAEVHRYAHGYHMLLRDLDRQIVWNEVVEWTRHVTQTRAQSAQGKSKVPS